MVRARNKNEVNGGNMAKTYLFNAGKNSVTHLHTYDCIIFKIGIWSLQMSLEAACNTMSPGTPQPKDLNGGSLNDVKDIYVEVDQRRVVFDEDVKRHVEMELERESIAMNKQHAEEELTRLKSRFEKWKKDYKARLRGTKARLRLNGHRNWCGKKSF